jgi:site-specific recombinase XerC
MAVILMFGSHDPRDSDMPRDPPTAGQGRGIDGVDEQPHSNHGAVQPARPASACLVPVRSVSAETQRLYLRDWSTFETWCAATGRTALPADPVAIASFLTEAAPRLSAGALARRVSAIAARHRQRGFAVPTLDRTVKAVLRTARRNAAPRRTPGPTPAQLLRLAGACGGDLIGLRDRALLLLMAVSGRGPAALVGLDVEHIRLTATAAEVILDGTGERLAIACDADRSRCPVQALRDWLQISDTQFGPVFRKIDRWGNIEHRRFSIAAVRQIIRRRSRRRARRAGKATAP